MFGQKGSMKEKYQPKEQIMNYNYTIFRPGGNDTALVNGIIRDTSKRKVINDAIMADNPNVEQVGFVYLDPNSPELLMAGGEFCGNATRCTAWSALEGLPGEVSIKVSGVERRLKAGVDNQGNAWAQMPIRSSFENVTRVGEQTAIVAMDGITQVVTYEPLPIELTEKEVKETAFRILEELNLTETVAASGVMFVSNKNNKLTLTPVVWVRDISTLFYETACGSGSTAVALEQAERLKQTTQLEITQPTGQPIIVQVKATTNGFDYAQISGPVEKVK